MSELQIDAGSAGTFTGYLAQPTATAKGCVVVVQEIYGVNREVRRVTDWLAAAGFAAVAPDLLWRVKPGLDFQYADRDNSRKAVSSLKPDEIVQDLAAAASALKRSAGGNLPMGIVSLGWGGKFAFMAAAKMDARAIVAFYPGNIEGAYDLVHSVQAPQMHHFAKHDERTKPEFRKALRTALADRDDVEVHVYPEADHGFANRDRAEFHGASAQLAEERSIAFLERNLRT